MLLLVVLVGPYLLWPPHVTGSPAVAVKFLSPRLTRYLLILFPSSITSLCPLLQALDFFSSSSYKKRLNRPLFPVSSFFWLCRGDVRPPPARSRLAGTARKQLLLRTAGERRSTRPLELVRDPSRAAAPSVQPWWPADHHPAVRPCSVSGAGGSVCRDSLRTSAVICNYLCGVSLFSP